MATNVGGTADLALLARLETEPRSGGKRGARALWCSGGREHRDSGERERGDHGELCPDGLDEANGETSGEAHGVTDTHGVDTVFSLFRTKQVNLQLESSCTGPGGYGKLTSTRDSRSEEHWINVVMVCYFKKWTSSVQSSRLFFIRIREGIALLRYSMMDSSSSQL